MAETADSAAATRATPNRQQPPPKGCTGPVGPESPRQNNIRTSKRHRVMDIRAPARFQLGRGANTQDRAGAATAATTNAVTSAIAPPFRRRQTRHSEARDHHYSLSRGYRQLYDGLQEPRGCGDRERPPAPGYPGHHHLSHQHGQQYQPPGQRGEQLFYFWKHVLKRTCTDTTSSHHTGATGRRHSHPTHGAYRNPTPGPSTNGYPTGYLRSNRTLDIRHSLGHSHEDGMGTHPSQQDNPQPTHGARKSGKNDLCR
ncbi:hypothetical protein K469DRAFT_696164 [Zopfia rhizophila CBS 207.26]|uniref:Uncharacterized protein n=1 Tax=Zopfia rhizophila CBS 207.26 TaxID=1314779 RepID=A0A6A6DEX8_9PEZI|nr:hypothetical protein K469DRAFT_696164 [Zopfia rhizophila CBS 207.26]